MSNEAKPGALLKALRLQKRLTLAEVSHRTGLPVSTISKVENNKMSLSYDKLQAISTGLGIDVGVLFKSAAEMPVESTSGRRSIHKVGEGRRVETHLTSYLHLASELLNKRFIPLLCEVRARSLSAFGAMVRHPGEEFTYVLQGALDLHSQLYAPVRLHAGESIYFDSGMAHAYVAVSKGPCKVLMICSSTEAQLFEAVDRSRPENPSDDALPPVKSKTIKSPSGKSKAAAHGRPRSRD